MKRFDYYFGDMAIISWYNKKMPKKEINKYTAMYGPLTKVEQSTMMTVQVKKEDAAEYRPVGFGRWE